MTPIDSPALQELAEMSAQENFLRGRRFSAWCRRAEKELAIGPLRVVALALRAAFGADGGRSRTRRQLRAVLEEGERWRDRHNARAVATVLDRHATLFDTVERYPLTARQREAVASDEDATLVIAGAGTGKTSTLLAKIVLLVQTGQCRPVEILAISFTRNSADELADRVEKVLGQPLDVDTFHRLGRRIIAKAQGAAPRTAPFLESPLDKNRHLNGLLEELACDDGFRRRLVEFLAYHRVPDRTEWQFSSMAEYHEWLRGNKIRSLDGTPKKSYQECLIANWLVLNGIRFQYEAPYEHDTRTPEYRQYCPDFHLPDHGIYIEHFGVDRDNRPAPFVDPERYRAGMAWKRDVHRQYGTRLVETFSWQHADGSLLNGLEKNLAALGCRAERISDGDALDLLNRAGVVSGLSELLSTFLTLYKGNGGQVIESHERWSASWHSRYRSGTAWTPADAGVPRDFRAASGHVRSGQCPRRPDRFRGHDQPGGRCGIRWSVSKSVPVHPRRRVPGHLARTRPARPGVAARARRLRTLLRR